MAEETARPAHKVLERSTLIQTLLAAGVSSDADAVFAGQVADAVIAGQVADAVIASQLSILRDLEELAEDLEDVSTDTTPDAESREHFIADQLRNIIGH